MRSSTGNDLRAMPCRFVWAPSFVILGRTNRCPARAWRNHMALMARPLPLQMTFPLATPSEGSIEAATTSMTGAASPAPGARERLRLAIVASDQRSGFLPLAEEAVRACPGDGDVLLLAALAALLDRNSERT